MSVQTEWAALIRDVPDFPKSGVLFKDITPVLADAAAFAAATAALADPWREAGVQAVLGIESRGFILGAALARALKCGFVPVRKPGKLPASVLSVEYGLEYGKDTLQMHRDALPPGTRVLIVDDVLASGGTLHAALSLARQQGCDVLGAAVLIELQALGGRGRWQADLPLTAVLRFP
ncbi:MULTISPECIES: adenine phosphoribosyltransferase [Pseudoxanthomonas]|jgi:adenine phosphoribosyltransferase|uniref:Adenine phosphoribosyltransferase n=1 Tax=Pseudoxanthomonas winnipegensis TaxID=2480810 RepID=A0A4Q8L5B9_9GAMM|nr:MULTISPECIES: adenine phosphoribosyltransferase [Pseudoxanthomonas]PZP63274.1 MAG: adenine phosphoribosyltransferase [Pseudoxanthomonas spadix]TAA21592.1 adenine phosphoribosyltransferase [Pseudoxanthomonas winnipegensis]TMN25499.1 adenine phosphoribosyltransferase [Pseudoxanthomonas sp. X-1]UAY76296.1 adenine phosphoribosyltransferase [Pseudoxanthomonas sp. X-1]